MSALPLIARHDPAAVIARTPAGPITLAQFLADVRQVAAQLPAERHILNMCEDRYRFLVGLAAGLCAGKLTLLPASHTPETVRRLRDFAPDIVCLHDGKGAEVDLPQCAFPAAPAVPDPAAPMPLIEAAQEAVCLFTSGSTGLPVPHRKTWGMLTQNGRAEAARLALPASCTVVGTVPPQHSYGLESTILLALHGDCATWAGRPFYPADIAAALAAVPCPRLLVTTPYHLRTLLDAGVDVPAVDMVLSATAPLSATLAQQAEGRLGAPLLEIYGCTETGQIASRRTSAGPAWDLLPGIRLEQEGDISFAAGGHVAGRQRLSDVIELQGESRFLLHGRHADMVNIAGKRTSLAYLNQQLLAIPGVADGCFFMPDESAAAPEGITRLCAFAAAPGLEVRQLLAALRERIDAIFLPRPLILLERLPRNGVSKLPRAELQALLERHAGGGA